MENKIKPAVQTAKNPVKSFFSALNAKRRKISLSLTMMLTTMMLTAASAFADDTSGGGGSGGGGGIDTNAGKDEFNALISFFALWIGRIGLVVAFVGGIMFALSIKNEDSEQKTRGIMTFASGFVVFALSKSLNLFGIEVPAF